MMLREYEFFNGAKRHAQLMKGRQMHINALADDSTDSASPSWAAGLLDFAKSASQIVQQNRMFNQNLSVAKSAGVPVGQAPSDAVVVRQASGGMNMQTVILLGAASVLGLALFKSMSRR